jgi:transcriptional regulator with XRE-family HTH domain
MKANNEDKVLRIKALMDYLNLSQKAFATAIGVDASNLNAILNGKRNLGGGMIDKIILSFNNISRDWIETGEGQMTIQPSTSITITNTGIAATINSGNVYQGVTATPAPEDEDIPEAEVAVIPTELYKEPNANLYEYTAVNDVETLPIVHQFSSHDRFYRVINSSMAPKLLASDLVALQRIDINDSTPGCVYMIDHRTKGSFLRKVTDQGETLLLTSYNKEDYPDFVVHKRDVLNLARVVGLIRTDI